MAGPKDMDVTVTIVGRPSNGQPVSFEMNPTELVFQNDHHDGFWVKFHVNDPDRTEYVFPDSASDAMWVREIEEVTPQSCPTESTYWNGFRAKGVTKANKLLTVRNKNGPLNGKSEQLFAFTLLFTKTPHEPNPNCVKFDPMGTNRNGPAAQNSTAAVLIALLVVAVAAVAAYKLFLS